jgi:hypothetical protein
MPTSNIPLSGFGVPTNPGITAQTPILSGVVDVQKKSPSISGIQRRMGLAYDKLVMEAEEREGSLSPKTIRTLGKLILEFEQVNTNLSNIQSQIRQDIRDKKRYFDEEKRLYKKEEESLRNLQGSFFGLRSKFAGLAAVLAGKALLEGRFGDAASNAGLAVTAMLPEIINIASGAVLTRVALGGMGRAAGGTVARVGGPRMPGMGGLGMLGLAAAVPLTMGAADVRRQELIRRQTGSAAISPEDVDRFQATVSRFDSILGQKGEGSPQQPKQAKVAVEDLMNERPKNYPGGGGGVSGNVNAADVIADTPQEKAFIASVREVEGTAGAQGYNTFFKGSQYGGDLSKLSVNRVAELQKKFLAEGRGNFAGGRSAAVGAGQFMEPENVVRAMGLDPAKEKFTPELQNRMILFLAKRKRRVDVSKPLTINDLRVLNEEWAGFGPRYGQTKRTLQQSLDIYNQNLREAQQVETKPAPRKKPSVTEDARSQSMQPTISGASDISLITIPGQQKVAKPQTPKSAPASSEVAFNTTFESVDRFTSNLILGVYGV